MHVPRPTPDSNLDGVPRNLHFGRPPEVEGKDRGPQVGAWLCPWVGLCHTAPAPALLGASGAELA